MSKPGPKPKPRMLLELAGNPGRRPINELEPVIDLPAIKPPIVAADKIASEEWDRVCRVMPPELYTAADMSALALYALSWSHLHHAQFVLDAEGYTTPTGDGGQKTHPAIALWNMAAMNLMKAAANLGLTPGARRGLQVPTGKSARPQTKFGDLIK